MRRAASVPWPAIANLSPQTGCMHQVMDPILPTVLAIFAQVAEYLPIPINTTALQPELLNQPG